MGYRTGIRDRAQRRTAGGRHTVKSQRIASLATVPPGATVCDLLAIHGPNGAAEDPPVPQFDYATCSESTSIVPSRR